MSVTTAIIARAALQDLISVLKQEGYDVIGPKRADDAIVYESLDSADELPVGWIDDQDGGRYRLRKNERAAMFDYVVGPHSWKRYLFPPQQLLSRVQRSGSDFEITQDKQTPRYAFIGARSCELHAIAVQDRVFAEGAFADPNYKARRASAFIVAVNCARPGGTCFCTSMATGPKATVGFDIALTEIIEDQRHEFVVETGTERGAEILSKLPQRDASPADLEQAQAISAKAASAMGRTMASDAAEALRNNPEHPRWDNVAARCLTCGNCTLVCPTCFCTTVEDSTDLSGANAERHRRWDSCFTVEFSYIHGGSIRNSNRSRYRQWLTHKLSTWHDQFGESGCVGCGRCITWCPVGIDITEEVRAIRTPL